MKIFERTYLYYAVGPEDLIQVIESGYRRLPLYPPGFYPICFRHYAQKVAKETNVTKNGQGFVLRFEVKTEFISKFQSHIIGSPDTEMYLIPSVDFDELRKAIIGKIDVTDAYQSGSLPRIEA